MMRNVSDRDSLDGDRQTETADSSTLRLAIVSTPRCGNTWLRRLLVSMLDLDEIPVYNPLTLDWNNLPRRCVIMTHWLRTEPFVSLLAENKFHVVTLTRHPLDVLISILHFVLHNPETNRWVDGLGGDERSIVGMSPLSPEFLAYATGERGKSLISVSRHWWQVPGVHHIRYEELVGDSETTLTKVLRAIGQSPRSPVADVVANHTLEKVRKLDGLHHWRGRPGHWKMLLPSASARLIAAAHHEAFDELGYVCDPDDALTNQRAEAHWFDWLCKPRLAG